MVDGKRMAERRKMRPYLNQASDVAGSQRLGAGREYVPGFLFAQLTSHDGLLQIIGSG